MGKVININDFGNDLSTYINQSHRDLSPDYMKAQLKNIFDRQGINDSNFAVIVLAIKDNGVAVEAHNTVSYIDKATAALVKKEDRKKFREKYQREPESEEDLKKANKPKITLYLDKVKLKLLASLSKIKQAIEEILASQGLSEYIGKPITSYTKYEINTSIRVEGLEGKELSAGLAEMISSEKSQKEKNKEEQMSDAEKADKDSRREQAGELTKDSAEEKKEVDPKKIEAMKANKNKKAEGPTNIEILQEKYKALDSIHDSLITSLTTAHYEPDIRERLSREFGATVLELQTLCINDGSNAAKEIINLCRNLENTVECVAKHPEQYHGMPLEKITDVLHKEDKNDFSGSSKTFGEGHDTHPEMFSEDHDHDHGYTTDGEHDHEHEDTHEHVDEHDHDLDAGGGLLGDHEHEHENNDLTSDMLEIKNSLGLDVNTKAEWNEFWASDEGRKLEQNMPSMAFSKHDNIPH